MRDGQNSEHLALFYDRLSSIGLTRRLLELARDEDLGPDQRDLTGELTSELMAADSPADAAVSDVSAFVNAREPCVLAGLAALPELLDVFDAELAVELFAVDGQRAEAGERIAKLAGPLRDIVRVERTLLNLLSRLSGIASRTAVFVAAAGERLRVLDTRKTTPGLRIFEKYAVACGGGDTHRLGLHDAVLIKDNHIAGLAHGELTEFVVRAAGFGRGAGASFVEIEVDTLDQLRSVLLAPSGCVDYVLLDNMGPDALREAVAIRNNAGSQIELEASGGVSLDTLPLIADTGVERVSIGSLTHQAVSVDIGLDRGERHDAGPSSPTKPESSRG